MCELAKSNILESGLEKGGRFMVLTALAHYLRPPEIRGDTDDRPDEVKVSRLTIADFARLSERQARRSLRQLIDSGLVEMVAQGGNGPGDANIYRLACLDLFENVAHACKKARRTVFAGFGKASESGEIRGLPATPENATRMIVIAAGAVLLEGHEKLAAQLLGMVGLGVQDIAQEGGHFVPLIQDTKKGDISRIRGTFDPAKGDISGQNPLYYNPRIILNARARVAWAQTHASTREAWRRLCEALQGSEHADRLAGWLDDLGGVQLVIASDDVPGELELQFLKPYSADQFAEWFEGVIRSELMSWSGGVAVISPQGVRVRWRGSGDMTFQAMGESWIDREGVEDAA